VYARNVEWQTQREEFNPNKTKRGKINCRETGKQSMKDTIDGKMGLSLLVFGKYRDRGSINEMDRDV